MTARFFISRVYGQPLHRGVDTSNMYDISRIEDVHFYSYWSEDDTLEAFMRANGTAFAFGRNDWIYVKNTYSWSYHTGYRFYNQTDLPHSAGQGRGWTGGCTNGQFVGIGADFNVHPIALECVSNTGVVFTNALLTAFQNPGHPGSTAEAPAHVVSSPENEGSATFLNSNFWGPGAFPAQEIAPEHRIAHLRGGPAETVSFQSCSFLQYNNTGGEGAAPLIDLEGRGSYTVSGNFFKTTRDPEAHVAVGDAVGSAVVVGNSFNRSPRVVRGRGCGEEDDDTHCFVNGNVYNRHQPPLAAPSRDRIWRAFTAAAAMAGDTAARPDDVADWRRRTANA